MKCLCFSDSHGSTALMRRALAMHRDAEVVFFLGDGLSDAYEIISENPTRAFYLVRGNCDIGGAYSNIEKTLFLNIMNKKIALTHGDLYGAKGGLGGLVSLAVREKCDIVLFGHTHEPLERYDSERELHLFNPGSISERYSGRSFGIITLTEDSVLFSHGCVF